MAQSLAHRRPNIGNTRHSPCGRWHSRAVLLIAMILLPLVGTLIYVGPAWANVLLRLWSDGGVTLLWLAGAARLGLFILRVAKLWDADTPGALRWAMAAGLGLGMISLMTLGLGLAGLLNGGVAWGMLATGWVLGAVSLWRLSPAPLDSGAGSSGEMGEPATSPLTPALSPEYMGEGAGSRGTAFRRWWAESAGWNWLFLIASPFLVLALASAMTPPGMLWTPEEPHGYDVIEYHLQVPREWYEAHRIIPLHHNVFSFFPFNVEMHYLLAMQLRGGPWAGMYVAQFMHLAFFILTVIAVYGLARRFAKRSSATIAALSLITVPWITQLAGIAYDEGGFLLFGILAIGLALAATFEGKQRVKRFILAGAFAGFAAGSKLTAVPEVLVAVPVVGAFAGLWMLIWKRPGEAVKELWLGIVLFGLVGLLSFSPWLIRNMVWAGNPVFPEMPVLGHGDFTPVQVERFEKAHKPPSALQPIGARLITLNREVLGWWPNGDGPTSAWQFGYLILPLALVAFALSVRRPESWCLLALLLILTAFWLAMTHLQSRFFILAAPIAAMLIACIDWRRWTVAAAALIVIFAAIGWVRINDRLITKFYGSNENAPGVASVLGADGSWLYGEMMPRDLPETGTVFLVGDARAFLYPIPMSRLRYRTVFDVKEGESDIVRAWIGSQQTSPGDVLVIDPGELRRFHQTYFGLPPLPADIEGRQAPFIVKK